MNKLFGFFKEKIVEANVQNKKDIETIVNVLSGDDTPYKSDIILSHLQKIKNNYMTWSILIANQASTGLYYSQLHNHSVCLKKATSSQQIQNNIQKNQILHQQMSKTHQQLTQITNLNQNWVKSVTSNIQTIKNLRIKQNNIKKERAQKLKRQKEQLQGNKILGKQDQKQEKENKGEEIRSEIQSSPIIITTLDSPVIEFSQQRNKSEIIISSERW